PAPRTSRQGQHPRRDRAAEPDVAGRARQVGAAEPARRAAARAAAERAGARRKRQPDQHDEDDARAARGAPEEQSVRVVPQADGPARVRARELRRRRPLPELRRELPADRQHGRLRRRHGHQRPDRPAPGAAEPLAALHRQPDRHADDVRARTRRRVLRRAVRSADRPRRGAEALQPSVAHRRHRAEYAIPDEESRVMIITKKALPRRTFLRGMGVSLALPLLDAMVPALTTAAAAARPVRRYGFYYMPNGVAMNHTGVNYWKPSTVGADFEFSQILKPLEPFRNQVTVVSGLHNRAAESFGDGNGDHTRSTGSWLTGAHIKRTEGSDLKA